MCPSSLHRRFSDGPSSSQDVTFFSFHAANDFLNGTQIVLGKRKDAKSYLAYQGRDVPLIGFGPLPHSQTNRWMKSPLKQEQQCLQLGLCTAEKLRQNTPSLFNVHTYNFRYLYRGFLFSFSFPSPLRSLLLHL